MRSWDSVRVPTVPGGGSGRVSIRDTVRGEVVPVGPESGEARLYACGITPYDATHLGHAFTYLTFDLLHRVWLDLGLAVDYVQNITDVDDPLLERAARARHRAEGIAMDELVRIAAADTLRYLDTKRQYPVFSSDVRRIFGEFVQGLRTPELIFTTDQLRVLLTDLVDQAARPQPRVRGLELLVAPGAGAAVAAHGQAPVQLAEQADLGGVEPRHLGDNRRQHVGQHVVRPHVAEHAVALGHRRAGGGNDVGFLDLFHRILLRGSEE